MRYLLAVLFCSGIAFGQSPPPGGWDSAFAAASVGGVPVGYYRGTVLSSDQAFPRVRARLQGLVWKGKDFHDDGTFINVWLGGLRASSAGTWVGPSVTDGQPALLVRYPRRFQAFGRDYDELRELTPGVWLGRRYDATSGRPKNWFLLQAR